MNLIWFRPWLPFPSLSHKAHRKTKTPIKTLIHVYPETDCLETKGNAFKILFAFCHWPACHLHLGIIELIGKMAFVILSATNFISRQQKTSTSSDLAGGHLSSLCTLAKKHFVLCCWLSWSHFGELKKKSVVLTVEKMQKNLFERMGTLCLQWQKQRISNARWIQFF